MAFSETGCEIIVTNNGIPLISDLLRIHSNNTDLIRMIYKLVSDLGFSAHLDNLVQSCASEVLTILRKRFQDPKLIKATLKIVSRFYLHSSRESRLLLLREEIIEALLQLLPLPQHAKQVKLILTNIAQAFLSYEKTPDSPPTLLEISARRFINSPNYDPQLLCSDLQTYISRAKRCHHCHQYFFDFEFERLSFLFFPEFPRVLLPQIQSLCSSQCFN